MDQLWLVIVVVAVWIILSKVVFPKLGLPG